ncbi:exported hypothetical protein [Candidatus Sulfopaludibacter sp. SbA3]|nr:exported hypothetical protein [Candidatus Sulfopaludibacter sp. SbA3]
MMRRAGRRKRLPHLAFALLSLAPLTAQEVAKTYQAGDVTFTVRVTPKNPVVADEVRLELEVTAPKDVHIELPDNPGVIDCAAVLDRDSPSPTIKSGRMTHRESFLLDPAGPGACHIPRLGIRYGAALMASQEIVFPIGSLIPPGETSPDIRDGQAPLPLPEQNVNWTVVTVGMLVVLAAIAWFTYGGRQLAPKAVPPEPAEVLARRRLMRLAKQRAMVPREFYSELSCILTAYLDERLALRSTRCTSPELLEAVQRTGFLAHPGRDLLEALLEDCDCAKFSPSCALGDNPEEAVACCRKIIDILCANAASRPRLMNANQELTRA